MSQTIHQAAGRLRALWTDVSRPGKLLLVAVVVDSVGSGLTLVHRLWTAAEAS